MVQTISVDDVLKEFYSTLWRGMSVKKYLSQCHVSEIFSTLHSYVEKSMVIEPETKYLNWAFEIVK